MAAWDVLERLEGLVIFRGLLTVPEVSAFRSALKAIAAHDGSRESNMVVIGAVASFDNMLLASRSDWSGLLIREVLEDDNAYLRSCAKRQARGTKAMAVPRRTSGEGDGAEPTAWTPTDDAVLADMTPAGDADASPALSEAAGRELVFLEKLSRIGISDLAEMVADDASLASFIRSLPAWKTGGFDFSQEYSERMSRISVTGYGIFARHHVFTFEEGKLVPVRHPDPQRLSDLPGYEQERSLILENTEALASGKPAVNVLLYGDAGTGKSSTVKAVANEYADRGIRLVEVKKEQLFELGSVMDELADNPLRFIIFIDDLSFSSGDGDFAALKAMLEGSVHAHASNVAVYATSNRRHLVKETFQDRTGGDLHESDTRQEMTSLAARFGLVVTFSRPDRGRFASILKQLAADAGLEIDPDELVRRGEAFAIRAGGRSPRVARQFVDMLSSGMRV